MIIGFFYILMQSGNKITNTRLIHLQYPQPPCQWQWQLPKTPCPLACPVNFGLQAIFILNNSGNKTWQPARNTSTTGENGQTDTCACSLQPHTPPPSMWKHISVASTLAPVPYTTPLCCHDNPMAWNGPQGEDFAGGFDHPHISSLLRPPINIGCPGMNG